MTMKAKDVRAVDRFLNTVSKLGLEDHEFTGERAMQFLADQVRREMERMVFDPPPNSLGVPDDMIFRGITSPEGDDDDEPSS